MIQLVYHEAGENGGKTVMQTCVNKTEQLTHVTIAGSEEAQSATRAIKSEEAT